MEIPFHGQIDLAVLRRMNRLVLMPSRGFLVVGCIVGVLFLWGLVVAPLTQGKPLTEMIPTLGIILAVMGTFAYALFMGPRKVLQSGKLLQDPITGIVTERGVRLETQHSQSEFAWAVFFKDSDRPRPGPALPVHPGLQSLPCEFFASDTDCQGVCRVRSPAGAAAAWEESRRLGKSPCYY